MEIHLQSVGFNQTMMHEHFWVIRKINKETLTQNLSIHSINGFFESSRALAVSLFLSCTLIFLWERIIPSWICCLVKSVPVDVCFARKMWSFVGFGSNLHGIDKLIWFKEYYIAKNILTNKLNYTRLIIVIIKIGFKGLYGQHHHITSNCHCLNVCHFIYNSRLYII